MSDYFQHSTVCACGQSFYSVDGRCNKCGVVREKTELEVQKFGAFRRSVGRVWDSKTHKYRKIAEGGLAHG